MPTKRGGPFLNKNGQWEIQGMECGRRFHEVLPKGRSRSDAKERERIIRKSYYDEEKLGRKLDYPISAAVMRWLGKERRSPKKAEGHAKALEDFIIGRTMSELVDVADKIKERAGWTNATKNRRIAILKVAAHDDYIAQRTDSALWDRIDFLPETPDKPARAYSRDEMAHILRGIRKGRKTHDARKIARAVYATLYTGLRSGELLALDPKDFTGDCVLIWNPKNGKARPVPVPAWAQWAFRRLPITVHESTLSHAVERHGKGRFHWVRHTYGSWLLAAGESIEIVSKLLGHSSVAVTSKVYSHIPTDAMKTVSTRGLRKRTPHKLHKAA